MPYTVSGYWRPGYALGDTPRGSAPFSWIPSYSPTEESSPRVRRSQFGKGYQHRNSPGINADPKRVSLSFIGIGNDERDEILEFLEMRNGTESFEWVDLRGRVGHRWVCPKWTFEPTSPSFCEITAVFREVLAP